MNNKRGISTIWIVLIVVGLLFFILVAITSAWFIIRSFTCNDCEGHDPNSKMLCVDARLTIDSNNSFCNLSSPDGPIKLTIQRRADNLGAIRMKVIVGENITDMDAPPTLGEKKITNLSTNLINSTEVTIKVAPMVGQNKDYLCDPTDSIILTCTN
jgi:hypothetical protein